MESELFRRHRNAILLAFVVVAVFALLVKRTTVPGAPAAPGLPSVNNFFARLNWNWLKMPVAPGAKGGPGLDNTGSAPLSWSSAFPTDAANTQIGIGGGFDADAGTGADLNTAIGAFSALDALGAIGGGVPADYYPTTGQIGATGAHAAPAAHAHTGFIGPTRGFGYDHVLVGARRGSR